MNDPQRTYLLVTVDAAAGPEELLAALRGRLEAVPGATVVALPPLLDMTDEERLTVINGRYMGRLHELDFRDVATREQLALDLGLLAGMCARLLDEARRRQGGRT